MVGPTASRTAEMTADWTVCRMAVGSEGGMAARLVDQKVAKRVFSMAVQWVYSMGASKAAKMVASRVVEMGELSDDVWAEKRVDSKVALMVALMVHP